MLDVEMENVKMEDVEMEDVKMVMMMMMRGRLATIVEEETKEVVDALLFPMSVDAILLKQDVDMADVEMEDVGMEDVKMEDRVDTLCSQGWSILCCSQGWSILCF